VKAVGSILVAFTLLGCGADMSDADRRMCDIAQQLSATITKVEQALVEDEAGNTDGARALATQARAEAEAAHDQLRAMDSDQARQLPARGGLLIAYLQTAQAADSMLPAFSNTHGMGREELASAIQALAKADANLPAACILPSRPPIVVPAEP
jgi:hypothetical protein